MSNNQQYKKRTGTLYRRWKGKDYSIDDPVAVKNGTIWLKYNLHGKVVRKSLRTTDLKVAEKERNSIMLPLQMADEAEATAQLELKARQARQKLGVVLQNRNPPLSIADAWTAYLHSHERPDSGERTLRDYQTHWNRFTEWLKSEHKDATAMKDITPDIASEYASELTKKKLSPNTFNKRINFLKLICTVLATPARLEINPFEKIKSRKLKTASKRELTQHELRSVLSSANGDLKLLLYIGTFTGLRLGDCVTLMWGEVDMDRLLIRRIPNKTRSRNPKPVVIGIPTPLYDLLNITPKNKRSGFILPKLAAIYQEDATKICGLIQKHFEEDCGIQTHKAGTGYQLVPDPEREGKFKKIHTGKRAVVEVGFHSLRHTFVSLHAVMGTPQAVVMAIVGHGSPAMTNHYTHIGDETARQAAGILTDPTSNPSSVQEADVEIVEENDVPE